MDPLKAFFPLSCSDYLRQDHSKCKYESHKIGQNFIHIQFYFKASVALFLHLGNSFA